MTTTNTPILTRTDAIATVQRLMQMYEAQQHNAVLDVFHDAYSLLLLTLGEDLDYLSGISDERFLETIGRATNGKEPAPTVQFFLVDDKLVGPQLDITAPQHGVQVSTTGKRLWVNVDGVCRLRVSNAPQVHVEANNRVLFKS